jgi:amino acid permease
MNPFIQMQVFFLISSFGFVFLWVLLAIFLFYLIRAASTFSRIMKRAEKDIDSIGDTTKEMLEEIRNNVIYNFLFKKKRKSHEKK